MNNFQLTYKQFGERSILIEWPSKIDINILEDVILFKEKIEKSLVKDMLKIKSAYCSILISYVEHIDIIYDNITALKSIYSSNINVISKPSLLWKIPVCYDDKFAIDLDEISAQNKITKEEIIKLHSQAIYTVFFIGFLPGFLYLGGLHKMINFPRRTTPRLQIKKGTVAIGGIQTGIYPSQSPGGWNVIGNSPINFFDVSKKTPCFAKSGDKIKFYEVSLKQHSDILTLVDAGVYQLESEVIRG